MATISENLSTSALEQAMQPRRVHTITDRFSMTNTYVINDNHLIVVDPSSALNVRLLASYVQTFLHRSPSDIDLVVLTNLHRDQSTGIEAIRHLCEAPLAVSSGALSITQTDIQKAQSRLNYTLPNTPPFFPPLATQQVRLVDIWLNDVGSLPLHPDWRVVASAGHTPECICLYNPFTHELLSGHTLATVERGTPVLRRGIDRNKLNETLHVLRSLPVHYLYPEHGRQIIGATPLAHVQVEW